MIQNSFSKTVDLLHRAMDANTIRRSVIANNLSNAGVPHWKRSDLNFESELKRALETEKQRPPLELTMTDSRHIPNWRERDYREVRPRRVLDYVSTSKPNGNNVDVEQEITRLVQNQLTYTLLAQAEAFEFSQINMVLR
ncbi:MAG: flagellar basal body rod protein FlgB [Spirochaetaceae bacterium]|jgi:flagellar basal-body rod protein FlgB|nr:flagellar basal body rod protein FlgB [Spirochaetaceae bacterium]